MTRIRGPRLLCAAAGVTAFAALSACTSMLDTTSLDIEATASCINAAGAYFLPKKVLTVPFQERYDRRQTAWVWNQYR